MEGPFNCDIGPCRWVGQVSIGDNPWPEELLPAANPQAQTASISARRARGMLNLLVRELGQKSACD